MEHRCKRCGECCKIVPDISWKEINRIKKAGYKGFYDEFKGRKFMKMVNGQCIFLKWGKDAAVCGIYKIRPEICRNYPSEVREDGDCRPRKLASDSLFEKWKQK